MTRAGVMRCTLLRQSQGSGIRGQRPRGDTDARLTAGELDEYSTALKVDLTFSNIEFPMQQAGG